MASKRDELNKLLSVVDDTLIASLDPKLGIIYIGGERASKERLANLKAEAQMITETDLWKIIYETPKELAQRAMFVDGKTLEDMQKGRSMLYTLATQKKIIDMFKAFIPK